MLADSYSLNLASLSKTPTQKKVIMKKMTCKQLGGACDIEFFASTFEEMADLSKKHAMEMFQNGDKLHVDAMNEMKKLMQSPNDMKTWMDDKRNEFNSLPESNDPL
jgi:hypothetical protein